MLKVYKYPVEINDYVEIKMPKGAQILHWDTQGEEAPRLPKFCMWALVDPQEQEVETRVFRFAGTGHPIQNFRKNLTFIGTVKVNDGEQIYHLFEVSGD